MERNDRALTPRASDAVRRPRSGMETDRRLVLLLALLLWQNGAAAELIFALLYVAMD